MDKNVEQSNVEITEELIVDLAVFSQTYIEQVRADILKNAGQIAKDSTLVRLLHEYSTRKQQEQTEYENDVRNAIKYGHEYKFPNNCLTHSSSYRDVLYDLLKPYFNQE